MTLMSLDKLITIKNLHICELVEGVVGRFAHQDIAGLEQLLEEVE